MTTPISAISPTAPDPDENDLSPLLSEPFARAWAAPAPDLPAPLGPRLGERLAGRLARSLQAEQGMVTVRRRSAAADPLGGGAQRRWLYRAPADRALRAGEPRAACVIELPAGASLALPPGGPREFLVLQGSAEVGQQLLAPRDFLLLPAGGGVQLSSHGGAQVFVREADAAGEGAARVAQATLVRDAEAGWPEFAPGIRRRVLWTGGGQAALLYQAEPGASVPTHSHGHDEECLMVDGELFLDDVLLQQGDYQLAPAGTGHRITETDTGVVIYAHGDADLRFT